MSSVERARHISTLAATRRQLSPMRTSRFPIGVTSHLPLDPHLQPLLPLANNQFIQVMSRFSSWVTRSPPVPRSATLTSQFSLPTNPATAARHWSPLIPLSSSTSGLSALGTGHVLPKGPRAIRSAPPLAPGEFIYIIRRLVVNDGPQDEYDEQQDWQETSNGRGPRRPAAAGRNPPRSLAIGREPGENPGVHAAQEEEVRALPGDQSAM